MQLRYHKQLLRDAIGQKVGLRALETITRGNFHQDSLLNLLKPEIHFDDSKFEEGNAHVDENRVKALRALAEGDFEITWFSFGRMTHTLQDFYAHSNYVTLWADSHPLEKNEPETIEALIPEIINSPNLISGRVYLPWDVLSLFPIFDPLLRRILPADSHANMNLDHPGRGPLFPYAIAAAEKRTKIEFDDFTAIVTAQLGERVLEKFYAK